MTRLFVHQTFLLYGTSRIYYVTLTPILLFKTDFRISTCKILEYQCVQGVVTLKVHVKTFATRIKSIGQFYFNTPYTNISIGNLAAVYTSDINSQLNRCWHYYLISYPIDCWVYQIVGLWIFVLFANPIQSQRQPTSVSEKSIHQKKVSRETDYARKSCPAGLDQY